MASALFGKFIADQYSDEIRRQRMTPAKCQETQRSQQYPQHAIAEPGGEPLGPRIAPPLDAFRHDLIEPQTAQERKLTDRVFVEQCLVRHVSRIVEAAQWRCPVRGTQDNDAAFRKP